MRDGLGVCEEIRDENEGARGMCDAYHPMTSPGLNQIDLLLARGDGFPPVSQVRLIWVSLLYLIGPS